MRNIRLIVEYDGRGLSGWQAQAGRPSVAGHLAEALRALTGETRAFGCAGRTDAGVHARAQVANFHTEVGWEARRFASGLNRMLPAQIRVLAATEAPADFLPRRSARAKHYRYTLLSAPHPAPLLVGRAWHLRRRLSLAPMRAAAAQMLGEQDFRAFRHAHCGAAHARRRMMRLRVTHRARPPAGELFTFDLVANAFCRHMCRIIVGTLVEVGAGVRSVEQVAALLGPEGDRRRAGPTAPPGGLTLMRVWPRRQPG